MKDYAPYLDWINGQHDRMCELVFTWAEVNSGSGHPAGLDRMLSLLEVEFGVLDGAMERLELRPWERVNSRGDIVQVRLGNALSIRKRPEAPVKVFLGIHYDTVYAPDGLFQKCFRVDEQTLRGPGVADAKGGLLVMLKALEAFERSPWAENLGWEILINPDEEIGSPGSKALLIEAAKRNHFGLVFEPAKVDGKLVGSRKGSGNFTVVVRGRAAHAGRDPHLGRNAIVALCEIVMRLVASQSSTDQVTINAGRIEGGGPLNVVPDLAIARFNVRVPTAEDQQEFERRLTEITVDSHYGSGISVSVHGGFARPPKPLEGKTLDLFNLVARCGRDLGLSIEWAPSGGASDGNTLQAAGLPTVDSLGARGGNIHSPDEYVLLDSLTERARLTALLLMKMASGGAFEEIAPGIPTVGRGRE